jgi:uncharacterized membrane protein HdeD (DUF308 family)
MTLASPNVFEVVRKKSGWFLALGVVLIILGVIALVDSLAATVVSMMIFGWILIFSGAFHVFHATQSGGWRGFALHMLVGLVDAFCGVWLIMRPFQAAVSLTLFLGAFFMVSGLLQIVASAARHLPNKTWAIISGVINFLLGLCIWVQWPASGLWFFGMCLGIALIFRGWMWINVAMAARKIASVAAPPAA